MFLIWCDCRHFPLRGIQSELLSKWLAPWPLRMYTRMYHSVRFWNCKTSSASTTRTFVCICRGQRPFWTNGEPIISWMIFNTFVCTHVKNAESEWEMINRWADEWASALNRIHTHTRAWSSSAPQRLSRRTTWDGMVGCAHECQTFYIFSTRVCRTY